jgi:hypothetical protein
METSTIVSYTQARNASIDEEPQTSAENARVCATTLNDWGAHLYHRFGVLNSSTPANELMTEDECAMADAKATIAAMLPPKHGSIAAAYEPGERERERMGFQPPQIAGWPPSLFNERNRHE